MPNEQNRHTPSPLYHPLCPAKGKEFYIVNMRKIFFLSLLLLLSCDKDDKLRLAIEDSPNANCLKSIFAKDTNFTLVGIKKADILVSIDSGLNYKNAKNGNEFKYLRQWTILGDPGGYGTPEAILGYEIDICDFAKKYASDFANLSLAEWALDSNANGKMYVNIFNPAGRISWIAQILIMEKDSIKFCRRFGCSRSYSSEATDTLLAFLTDFHERFHDDSGLEDVYLGNTMYIYFPDTVRIEDFAKITNIARKAGYSHVIYEHEGDISNTDKAKNLLNSLYHNYNMFGDTDSYEKKKKEESSTYFDSYMANLLSLEKGHLGWDFVYNLQGKLKSATGIDFETKSTEPIQIIAKIIEFKNFHKLETYKVIGEVLFSFVEENGTLKISDVETKGASLRETLEKGTVTDTRE